jgi:hypothetical protein
MNLGMDCSDHQVFLGFAMIIIGVFQAGAGFTRGDLAFGGLGVAYTALGVMCLWDEVVSLPTHRDSYLPAIFTVQ